MRRLPEGWVTSPLRDLLAPLTDGRFLHQGWSPQCEKGASPNDEVWGVLKTTAIQDGRFLPEHNKKLPAELEPRPLLEVRGGDLLLTCAGPRVRCGVTCLVRATRPRLMISGKMYRMRVATPDIESRFVEAVLRAPETQEVIDGMKTGMSESGMNLTHERFARLEVPLPPSNEQKRIADKLDALLARVDACGERLDRVPLLLKRFRQAVLAAATSGELTEEWREENPDKVDARQLTAAIRQRHEAAGGHKAGNAAPPTEDVHNLSEDMFPDGWSLLTLRDLVLPDRPITYGILKPGPELEDGVPYVRVADFPNDKLNLASIRKTSKTMDEEFKRSRLRSGDLLLSIRGTVGRLVVIPPELVGANITQDSARLSIQPEANRDYVLWYLRSELAQGRMKGAVKGVAVRGINIGDVRALQVPLPSREEQDEIVRRVESLFAFADRLEARYQAARAHVDRITPALLAKAFRGDLVPQDPNDEPASVLLERIRAEHAASAPAKLVRAKAVRQALPTTHPPSPHPLPLAGEGAKTKPRNIPGAILAHMQPDVSYSRADLTGALGISLADWTWAIEQLKESGQAAQTGVKRGARYSLCVPNRLAGE